MAHAMVMCMLVAMAVPELSEPQRLQVEATSDFNQQFDGPGLYPLLENTAWWKQGDESGAAVPIASKIAVERS